MPEPHLTDRELIQAADGELAGREAAVRRHLEACWSCRARLHEIEGIIAEFVREHQGGGAAPSAEGPRAMLRARIAEISEAAPQSWRERLALVFAERSTWVYTGGALLLLTAAMFWGSPGGRASQALVPDPRLTPGATVPVSTAEVCAPQAPLQASFIPVSVGRGVFERYGIGDPGPSAYELDYLIAPELGGADDPRNFWPQPYSAAVWNAHLKDALEDHLHELVCEGALTLEQAQRDLATDWISAYKKYFRTESPIASHAEFTKDLPWVDRP